MHFAIDWAKRIDFDLLRQERLKSLNAQIIDVIVLPDPVAISSMPLKSFFTHASTASP